MPKLNSLHKYFPLKINLSVILVNPVIAVHLEDQLLDRRKVTKGCVEYRYKKDKMEMSNTAK